MYVHKPDHINIFMTQINILTDPCAEKVLHMFRATLQFSVFTVSSSWLTVPICGNMPHQKTPKITDKTAPKMTSRCLNIALWNTIFQIIDKRCNWSSGKQWQVKKKEKEEKDSGYSRTLQISCWAAPGLSVTQCDPAPKEMPMMTMQMWMVSPSPWPSLLPSDDL